MDKLTVADVTLRDGNHTVRQQFTPEIMSRVAAALEAADVDPGARGETLAVSRTFSHRFKAM